MKKLMVLIFSIILIFSSISQAFAIFTPPGDPVVSQEDIIYAEKAVGSIKWDWSMASKENKITLTLPLVDNSHRWIINRDIGKYIGVWKDWKEAYFGKGGEKIDIPLSNPEGTGIYVDLINFTNGRAIAHETYVYYPESGVNYVPVEERRSAPADESEKYIDEWGNEVVETGDKVIKYNRNIPVFTDLTYEHWAYKVISELSGLGYIKGYPDGTFKPSGNITRAEFMVMFSKLITSKTIDVYQLNNSVVNYTDFTSSHWAYKQTQDLLKYIDATDLNNIFGKHLEPEKKITREEVVAIIYSVLKNHNNSSNSSSKVNFTDIDKSKFKESIMFGVGDGFIQGYSDGTFKPSGNITRAEIAAILVLVNKSFNPVIGR